MTTISDLDRYVIDDPARGVFQVHRDIFHDPEIFELEMKAIFEGTWIFLAMESQLPAPFDFYCTTIGRQPVILMRNQAGALAPSSIAAGTRARGCATPRPGMPSG